MARKFTAETHNAGLMEVQATPTPNAPFQPSTSVDPGPLRHVTFMNAAGAVAKDWFGRVIHNKRMQSEARSTKQEWKSERAIKKESKELGKAETEATKGNLVRAEEHERAAIERQRQAEKLHTESALYEDVAILLRKNPVQAPPIAAPIAAPSTLPLSTAPLSSAANAMPGAPYYGGNAMPGAPYYGGNAPLQYGRTMGGVGAPVAPMATSFRNTPAGYNYPGSSFPSSFDNTNVPLSYNNNAQVREDIYVNPNSTTIVERIVPGPSSYITPATNTTYRT